MTDPDDDRLVRTMTPIDAARILTLWQPWATLMMPIPGGRFSDPIPPRKRIETRPMSTKYRGPVLIHAAANRTVPRRMMRMPEGMMGEWWVVDVDGEPALLDHRVGHGGDVDLYELPLGVVVGVSDLTDVLPITKCTDHHPHLCTSAGTLLQHTALDSPDAAGDTEIDRSAEYPFGDYTDGRFGWIFENARAFDKPIPWKGAQGLRHAPPELLDLANTALRCPTCRGRGTVPPDYPVLAYSEWPACEACAGSGERPSPALPKGTTNP